jgi:hypothetical protein
LHLKGIVKAVEVVKEPDGAEQFHDFTFRVEAAQVGELIVADRVGIAGDGFGQAQGGFFRGGKILALRPLGQVSELIVGPSQTARENGVAG